MTEVLIINTSYKYLSMGISVLKNDGERYAHVSAMPKHKARYMSLFGKGGIKTYPASLSWVYGSEGHPIKKFGDFLFVDGIVKPTGEELTKINQLRQEIKAKQEELDNYLRENVNKFNNLDLETAEAFSKKNEDYFEKKAQVFKEKGWVKA
jgi:hypothetical protein